MATITIGIPAYNEEDNIGHLLESLLEQKLVGCEIKNIIVNSDGSNDKTGEIVNSFEDSRVTLWDDRARKGQGVRQNEVISKAKSDILVLLNADIKLSGSDYIQKLVAPIMTGSDLVSSKVLPMPPKTFIESVFCASYDYKEDLFESLNGGNNIYTCKGAARAMSARFYKEFRFGKSVGEDAYSYLYCLKNNYNYSYQPGCIAYIRLPNNLSDYFKQSTRFIDSITGFSDLFGVDFVARQYAFPKKIMVGALVKNLLKNPLRMSMYLVIFGVSNIITRFGGETKSSQTWETAKSSKKLV